MNFSSKNIQVTSSSCDKTGNNEETSNKHISLKKNSLQYAVKVKAYFLCVENFEGLDIKCQVEIKLEGTDVKVRKHTKITDFFLISACMQFLKFSLEF